MARLRVESGPQVGREYNLSTQNNTIGRHPGCEIVLDVGAVSRKHARITGAPDGHTYWIEDLSSRNGTQVNNLAIHAPTPLQNGDSIRICDVDLSFLGPPSSGQPSSQILRERSGMNTVLIDDEDQAAASQSTIMSRIDVSSQQQRAKLTTTPQAKLQAIMEITQALSKVLTLEDVFPKVLDSLFSIFPQADRGFIVMKSGADELVPTWSKTRRDMGGETLRISRRIVNHVLHSKTAILSKDAASDERFNPSQSVANLQIRSFMCAPLMDGEGEILGVIQIDTLDSANLFTEEDLEVLATVALQAGIAIDNAKMHHAAVEQTELARDLELATDVQHGFLPLQPPAIDGYDFYDFYQPANHVGGDYYDYIKLPDGRVAIVVADVVGHGIAAALLMAKLSAETRFSLATESDLGTAMSRLNNAIVELQLDRFVTMVIALLDPSTHRLKVVNAGHLPPFRRNAQGEVEELCQSISGLPLGILDDYEYKQHEAAVAAGDTILLMTDGVFESENGSEAPFGIPAIKSLLAGGSGDAQKTGKHLISAVKKHLGQQAPNDDMCLVCVHRA
jgi:sigma-B regulation protein RsbU (phosphoserine phosphatase)